MLSIVLELNEPGVTTLDILSMVQRDAITQALHAADGNITHAATLLGTTRQSLQRRMRRLRVQPPSKARRVQKSSASSVLAT